MLVPHHAPLTVGDAEYWVISSLLVSQVKFRIMVVFRSYHLNQGEFSHKAYIFDLKPGLHIVVRIAEHACDDASKRILKLSEYRMKKFIVKYQNLRSFQR